MTKKCTGDKPRPLPGAEPARWAATQEIFQAPWGLPWTWDWVQVWPWGQKLASFQRILGFRSMAGAVGPNVTSFFGRRHSLGPPPGPRAALAPGAARAAPPWPAPAAWSRGRRRCAGASRRSSPAPRGAASHPLPEPRSFPALISFRRKKRLGAIAVRASNLVSFRVLLPWSTEWLSG